MSAPRPDRATFEDLADRYPIVPVWREVLTDLQTPVAAFARLRGGSRDAFLLESVEGGARWGRYSFIGGDAFATVTAKHGRVWTDGVPPVRPGRGEPPLGFLERLLEACRAPALEGLPPLHGGAVGYLGYDCVREIERLPGGPPDDLGLPDLALILTRSFVVFDHFSQRAFVITNVPTFAEDQAGYDEAVARCDDVVERLGGPLDAPPLELATDAAIDFSSVVGDDEFGGWVKRVKEHIYAGDIFQVVPSRRFEARLSGAPFDVYRALRTLNPSPYMYFLHFGATDDHDDIDIAGSSPEPMVRVTGDVVVARPIAGTRARGADEAEDRALEEDLLKDEKERAEHVMLVDLARNDVGRVARYGSVTVDELMQVERYSHVMHIVSNVSGRLAPGRSAFDALRACFPAGTVSGAPKVRAMEIIDSLEVTRRGPYAGAVGYFDFSGNLDTCITIRTIVATEGRAYVQAGAGVVADSIPEQEVEETRRKAEALLRAAGAVSPKVSGLGRAQPS
ncbi:anthranilate synthase component I [soil metagenome]